MNIGGLLARAALLKEQMKKKPCPSCGLHFYPEIEEKCPQCGDLDENGLARIVAQRVREHQANRKLGEWFFLAAILALIFIFLVSV